MKTARIYVDTNEMIRENCVLLSRTDTKLDSEGNLITFYEGMPIAAYMEDYDRDGKRDDLVADGTAQLNTYDGWGSNVKWVLKMDERGFRCESEDNSNS